MTSEVKVEFDIVTFEKEVSDICNLDVTFTEAIIMWSERNNIEIELISSIIKKNSILKSRLEEDARMRRLLK